jgi:hypothetical protein
LRTGNCPINGPSANAFQDASHARRDLGKTLLAGRVRIN